MPLLGLFSVVAAAEPRPVALPSPPSAPPGCKPASDFMSLQAAILSNASCVDVSTASRITWSPNSPIPIKLAERAQMRIFSKNKTVLDGNQSSILFSIDSRYDSAIEFEGLTFMRSKGTSRTHSAAISINTCGLLNLVSCSFENN